MLLARVCTAALAAILAAGAVPATAAQADSRGGPKLLVPAVKAVRSGTPTWVKAYWGTTRDICDAKVTVHVAHTDVQYPSNTDSYTSFMRDDTLTVGATDYTAFRVTTTVRHTQLRAMHLTMRYRTWSKNGCAGKVETRTFYATLPVHKK